MIGIRRAGSAGLAAGLLFLLGGIQAALATPSAPALLWPVDGDPAVAPSADLAWQPVAGALEYYIRVYDWTGKPVMVGRTPAAAAAAALRAGGPYYWHVWARDASGWSASSGLRRFAVVLCPFTARGWRFVKHVVVDPKSPWTDTGVDLGSSNLGLFAWGRTQPTTPPHQAYPSGFGPDGAEFPAGPNRPLAPLPSAPFMGLLVRIGDRGEPFFLGRSRNLSSELGAGRLFLGVNDDACEDNQGTLYVDIYRQP